MRRFNKSTVFLSVAVVGDFADYEVKNYSKREAAIEEGYIFLFGNKACDPPFDSKRWYKVKKRDKIEYNE